MHKYGPLCMHICVTYGCKKIGRGSERRPLEGARERGTSGHAGEPTLRGQTQRGLLVLRCSGLVGEGRPVAVHASS